MRIIKAIIIFVLLLSLEIFLLLFISASNSTGIFVTVSKCLVNDRYNIECNDGLNLGLIVLFVVFNFAASFVFSKSFLFEEIKDWKLQVQKELSQLQSFYSSNDNVKLKHALIESDKLLCFTLKMLKYKGNNNFERIKKLENILDSATYKQLKKARFIRNKIVHEVGFEVEPKELQNHFWIIRKVILKLLS